MYILNLKKCCKNGTTILEKCWIIEERKGQEGWEMEELTLQAKEARRDYKRRYRIRNREKINRQQREWRADNPDRVRRYQAAYWEKAAAKAKNIRASWEEYGITPERLDELIGIVRSGKCDDVVLSAARRADESAAGHIIMSVKENVSYDILEAKQAAGKIERIALGRSDFYGTRRLFFHYLDTALKRVKHIPEGEY